MGKSLGRRNHRCTRAFGKAVLFSIFFCGCKLPKSFHIGLSAAKVRISSRTCASGPYFFRLFRNAGPRMEETCRGRAGAYVCAPVRIRDGMVQFGRADRASLRFWKNRSNTPHDNVVGTHGGMGASSCALNSARGRTPFRPGAESFPSSGGEEGEVRTRKSPPWRGFGASLPAGSSLHYIEKKETKMLILPGAACLHTRRRP